MCLRIFPIVIIGLLWVVLPNLFAEDIFPGDNRGYLNQELPLQEPRRPRFWWDSWQVWCNNATQI